MKIVIIEDENLTAEDLKDVIHKAIPDAEVVAMLSSVEESIQYFKTHDQPQLIFSDIQLGDGLSFEIFKELSIQVPVIFCTAFDEYAIRAFDANGIHYVLKPFNVTKIKEAYEKYQMLQHNFTQQQHVLEHIFESASLQSAIQSTVKRNNAILVYYQDKVIPIKLEDIALFYIRNEATHVYTIQQKSYVINKSLDELQQLDTYLFYRANRQYIVNRNVVKEAAQYMSRKVSITLNIPFNDTITISKEKITQFYDWLMGENL